VTANELRELLNAQKLVAIPWALARDKRLKDVDVRLAYILADWAMGTASCRPMNVDIARALGKSISVIKRSLRQLVDAGLISLEDDPLPPCPSRVIRLNWAQLRPAKKEPEPSSHALTILRMDTSVQRVKFDPETAENEDSGVDFDPPEQSYIATKKGGDGK
jgi:hypothetical protein